MRTKRNGILTLLLAFVVHLSFAQDKTITGTVTDQDGLPLPGVNIIVQGTTTGTQTGFDGNYAIQASEGQTLLFSYIGQKDERRNVGVSNILNIQMEDDAEALDEVVVTGTGVPTSKRRAAIAVEAVKAEELTPAPASDLSQALIGQIPGAQIQSTSGQPGQQQNILLRGINSLSTTQPMIMIDGVQINTDNSNNGSASNVSSRLADIDLSNVDRIEVIQGAAAGTIYGAQGANGVIQIFTKKGKAGKIRVNFRSNVGFSAALRGKLGKSNRHYFETTDDGFLANTDGSRLLPDTSTGVWPTPIGNIDANTEVNKPFGENTFNQLDQIFKKNAATINTSLSVSGGSEKVTFNVSLSHLDQESIIFGKLKRNNFRTSVTANITDKLKLSSSTTLIGSNNNTGGVTGTNSVFSGLSNSLLVPQYINNRNRDALGNFVATPTGDNSVNPFFTFQNRQFKTDVVRLIQNININYKPFKFLELDYKYGIDHYENKFRDFQKNQTLLLTQGLPPFTGTLEEQTDTGTTQNSLLSAFVRFDTEKDFGWSFPITSTTHLAYDWRREDFSQVEITGTELPTFSDNLNLNQTGTQSVLAYDESFRTFGYLINQKLDFGNYFGISGGVRVDWSSAFGQGSDPFVFPRGDVYLRVDELGLFNNNGVVNQFKLRAAYGEAGIQPDPFDRIPILSSGQILNTPILTLPNELQNPQLNVQVSKEFEFGTDITLSPSKGDWFNKIDLSATYYTRESNDVIRAIDIAPSQGAPSLLTNAITIETQGFQASLKASVVNKKDFSWLTTVNFGTFKSDIADIVNGADIALGNNHILREGAPVGAFFGLSPLTSVDQTRSDGSRYIDQSAVADFEIGPRGFIVNKSTKQAQLTDEQALIGDPTPDFNISFIQNFSMFEHLDFSFQLDWVQGNDIYNQTKQWLYRDLLHKDVSVPVTINNETGAWAAFYSNLYATNNPNAAFVEDGSFLRLRNLSLSYDLGYLIDGISSLRFTLAGNNLITWTNYTGIDPEAASNFNDPTERGLDQWAFPNFRTYSFGINIGF